MSFLGGGGPDIPQVPFDIPTPDVPAANFQQIGSDLEKGRQAAAAAAQGASGAFAWLADFMASLASAVLGIWLWLVQKLLGFILQILASSSAEQEGITATVLGGLLAGKHDAHTFSLVSALMNNLKSGAGAAGGGGIPPSSTGAENFLQLSTRLQIEGWIWGVAAEEASLGFLKDIGGLKDALENGLGLGRLARRALAPPMKIFVADPFTWLLNRTYRPTLLAPAELVRQYLRGIINRTELDAEMALHGYTADRIEALININRLHLSPGDIHLLYSHNEIDLASAKDLLGALGYDPATAGLLIKAQSYARADALQFELDRLATDLSAQGKGSALSGLVLQPTDDIVELRKQYLTSLGELKKIAFEKRFSVGQAELLVKKGLWDVGKLHELAVLEGYSDEDATDLELLVLGEIKDASDAAAKRAAAAKTRADAAAARLQAAKAKAAAVIADAEAHGLSLSKYETLVKDGVKTIAQYQAYLSLKGIAPDNAAALTTVLQAALGKAKSTSAGKPALAAAAKSKNLDLSQLEQSVKAGIFTLDEYQARLKQVGFADADVQLLVELLTDQINAAKTKTATKTAAKVQLGAKGVNLAQEEKGVRLGLATLDQYAAFLDGHGFTPEDRDILVGELQVQLTADAAARTTKSNIAGALKQKGVPLAALERAVRAGVSTTEQYRAALAAQGYDANAQDTLVSLLELQVFQDAHTLAAKGNAADLLDQRGLSLVDLERAVKLGVVPMTVYSDALGRAGVGAADAQVLVLSLAAQVKGTKKAAGAKSAVAALLSAAGLSLASMEAGVVSGRLTLQQFESQLAAVGVSAADAAPVVTLVSDELANAAAGGALNARVARAAAAKGLSLSEETAAVKADVKTLDDYRAFVMALGFDAADVETLTLTLAAQLAKAAAPKGKKAPGGAGSTPVAAPGGIPGG